MAGALFGYVTLSRLSDSSGNTQLCCWGGHVRCALQYTMHRAVCDDRDRWIHPGQSISPHVHKYLHEDTLLWSYCIKRPRAWAMPCCPPNWERNHIFFGLEHSSTLRSWRPYGLNPTQNLWGIGRSRIASGKRCFAKCCGKSGGS